MASTSRYSEDAIRYEDVSRVMAEARVLRSQAARDVAVWVAARLRALFATGGRTGGDRALRLALAGLDARSLRDLGLPVDAARDATIASLADHPMVVGPARRVANENAAIAAGARSAA